MKIHEKQSLFSLWLGTFSVINRSMGNVFKAIAILFVLPLVLMGVLGTFVFVRAPMVVMVLSVVSGIYIGCMSLALSIILYRIIDSEIEETHESLAESVTTSIMPTLYMFVYSIGLGILSAAVSFIGTFTDSKLLMGLLNVAFFFCITLRVMFAPMAMAVRGLGPVDAVVHSWRLTSGSGYIRTLGMWAISLILPILTVVATIGLVYGAYVCIPLFFANSFDLSHLTWPWYVAGILLAIIFVFIGLCIFAYPFVVFLNMDSRLYQAEWGVVADVHMVEEKVEENATQRTPQARGAHPHKKTIEVEDLTIEHSSVSNDAHDDTFSEHLKQVYNPQNTDVIEYTEEDRMPTIMFDDAMAKQLEENRKMWNKPAAADTTQNKPDDPNPEGTIKMSR